MCGWRGVRLHEHLPRLAFKCRILVNVKIFVNRPISSEVGTPFAICLR